ncbi:uncharacterized protein LOC144866390 [Branchiostoma floridae x Branchiostoma japonicum]
MDEENKKETKEEALAEAAQHGDTVRVKQLLEEGVNPNYTYNFFKQTSLHRAAENGHHETVSVLLTAGADVNTQDGSGMTPLYRAVLLGHHETVSALLTAGADVNTQDWSQRTPLHRAAVNDHHETVSALLAAGADVNAWDRWVQTSLHLTGLKGHHETVSVLLAAGADVNTPDSWQRTPLHLAAVNGHHETVSVLLAAGADANTQDESGITPLHLAAGNGHHETVSALLRAGADVNTQDSWGCTPFQRATMASHSECVQVLLQHGAGTDVRNKLAVMDHIPAPDDTLLGATALSSSGSSNYLTPDWILDDDFTPADGAWTPGHDDYYPLMTLFPTGYDMAVRKRHHDNLSGRGQAKKMKLASVPVEVEMGGPEMRALYEQACRKGTTQVFYTRLILVGQHGNGKSSLKNSLLQLEFHEDEESTDGIVITSCLMTGKKEWRITKGMMDCEFTHAAAMEMKKMKEEKQEQSVSRRTDGDGVQPKQTRSDPPENRGHKSSVVSSSQPFVSKQPSSQPRRTATPPEEYKRATQIVLGKDDLSHVVGSKEHPAMSIWDYAGHDMYYSSHHVFYSHFAIYIVTLNLEKPLDTPLEPWPGNCAEALQLRTEGDVVDYHLESIQAHTGPNKRTLLNDDQELDVKQNKGPPVIVVGTRKDQVQQTQIDEFFSNLEEHFSGKAIDCLVHDRYFAIDNTKRDPEDPELSELRDCILKIAQQQNHMGRTIPIRWLELKSKLMVMEKQGRKYCSLQEVMEATDSSDLPEGVTPEENAATILRFFHLCGDILFFNSPELRNFVVLDPQWFVDVQKTIITIPQFRDPEVKEKWRVLETTGMLEDSLIEHVWKKRQEELKCDLIKHKDELLKMMEQFDLVLQCSPRRDGKTGTSTSNSQNPTYFVPSLLTAVKNKEKIYPKGVKCSKPIFAVFDDKFCPVGVYHRLVITSMR